MPSVERLKERLALTLKARKLDAALGALTLLAKEEPDEPTWPRRAARLFRARSDRRREIAALRRALDIQIDRGLVLDAIATCKTILEVAPEDERTLETLDLLYLDRPAPAESDSIAGSKHESGMPADGEGAPARRRPGGGDEPLDALVLTEVVPGARPVVMGSGDEGGVAEIPIDAAGETEEPLDLHLDEWSSSADLRDVAAAQAVCLPKRAESAAGTGERGASLRMELANIPLFGDLDPSSLHTLIRRVRVVTLEAGQVLFRQGDPANSLYVIVDGAVVPIAEGERRYKLAVLERGEFFGEIGLLGEQPRNATIEAIVETKLLAIDRRLMWDLIEGEASVAKGLLRFLRARLIDRQMRTNPFFSAFARAERAAVARQFRFLEVDAETRLFDQGEAPEGLFLVLSGRLALLKRDDGSGSQKEVGTLGLGDVFGGLSLIDGRAPEAGVVARSRCWLVVLGEGRFRRILDANPHLDRVLRRIATSATGKKLESGAMPL